MNNKAMHTFRPKGTIQTVNAALCLPSEYGVKVI